MAKYKIFIIDDEPMIIKGLKELVPWNDIGCEVIGVAKNGQAGLEAIQDLSPNIVISDIRMPKLSGLEMIEAIRQVNQDIKFIILTGHRDFDYAKKAINLGVVKYLLKPTNIEDIKGAVAEAMVMLDEEHAKDDDIKALREKLAQMAQDNKIDPLHDPKSNTTSDQGTKASSINKDDASESDSKVKYLAASAVAYMQEHFAEKLDLQTLADNLFISSWYLCKVLKKEFDNSFVRMLNEIRIQEARRLLVETNYKVYEICDMVGYTDNPYFTKTFKKYTGMTPNQYRNSQY